MIFNKEQVEIIRQVGKQADEVICDERKGVPQGFYVIEIPKTIYYDNNGNEKNVPEELVGFWKMSFLEDISCDSYPYFVKGYEWLKVESVPVTTYEWKEI